MPDDNAHATDDTRHLRARFPRWGILFDPLEGVWVAVRGKRTLVAASSPEKLTEQVEAAARGEAGPDEGDKTQTWRTLRNHGRGRRPREAGSLREPFTRAAVATGQRPGSLFDD
jgi:hypothetical protein